MTIISKELTLNELRTQLGVTASWVGKAIRELGMTQHGRGKLRLFTRDEYFIFRNIKILRACDISWSSIKELKDREEKAERIVLKQIANLENKFKEGKIGIERERARIDFIVALPIEFDIAEYYYKEGDPKFSEGTRGDCHKEIEDILSAQGFGRETQLIAEEIQKKETELKGLKDNLGLYYKTYAKEKSAPY